MIRGISYKFRHNTFRYNNFIRSRARVVIVIIGVIAIVSVIMFFPHLIRNTYKVTITNKQIIRRNNIDEYLIYAQTEDGRLRVFKDFNNFMELKFNSEDLYLAISINKKYEVKAYGFNIPLLLNYQNILSAKGI